LSELSPSARLLRLIFSDGVASQFLAFNSGIEATIAVSERIGHLVAAWGAWEAGSPRCRAFRRDLRRLRGRDAKSRPGDDEYAAEVASH
jgi:hypothetical protein